MKKNVLFSHHQLGRRVGFRYLRAKKSSSFLSLITSISIGGVAVGVMTLIVTLCVMAGFELELKRRLFEAETHILIQAKDGGNISKNTDLISQIQKGENGSQINTVYASLQTEVILRSGKKVNGSLLKGVEWDQLQWVESKVYEKLNEAELSEVKEYPRIYVGMEMALDLGLSPGDFVTAVSPIESDGPMGAIPRVRKFLVAGIYKTGVPEQELHVAFTPIEGVESFLNHKAGYSQIEVQLKSLDQAAQVTRSIQDGMGASASQYLVRSWEELNQHLFQSLRLERAAMFFILIIIIVVATFNIVSTLTMMVIEKRKSLSILRTMGATRKQIRLIFLWEGFAIGCVGIFLGLFGGVLVCEILSRYPVIELPEYFYDRSLPVVVSPPVLFTVCMTGFIIVLLGSIVPAKKAARLPLMEGLK